MDTRSLLSGALLVAGLVLAFAGCDGVGTSPDEIESDTTGTSAFRPSPKDSAAISDSLKRVAPGDTLTVPIEAVANEPDSTEGSGPLQFDSVAVSDSGPAEVELQNSDTEAVLTAADTASDGSVEMAFRPAYGEFVSEETGTLAVTIQEANQAPEIENEIADQTLQVDETFEEDLTSVFDDPDGDDLTFGASSGDADVATATVNGTTLEVTGQSEGSVTITYTANDGSATAEGTFEMTVSP